MGTPNATARPPGRITGPHSPGRPSPVRSERVGVGGVVWVEHAARSRAPRPPQHAFCVIGDTPLPPFVTARL